MRSPPRLISYESMGTRWQVTIWDQMDASRCHALERKILADSTAFDETYSRFKKNSLIWQLTREKGVVTVPVQLVEMLKLYEKLHDLSDGKCNPLVGFALSDLGYDAEYSLKRKDAVRPVPNFHDAVRIIDDTHIELLQSALIDLGALGKGYFVDVISNFLIKEGINRFLVDGSGDIYYKGNGQSINAGLEHPGDTTKVVGVVPMENGAMCSSAGNRRRWGKQHHTIDPFSLESPSQIVATWVMADSAAVADGLATCLFFVEPERFMKDFTFECCMMNTEDHIKRSAGFAAELF